MEITQEPKRGRGRPKNSNSFVAVDVEYITRLMAQGGKIPVSKKWLESCGVNTEGMPAVKTQELDNKKLNKKPVVIAEVEPDIVETLPEPEESNENSFPVVAGETDDEERIEFTIEA